MKNLVKLTLLAALLLCGSTTYAQKFGYVNSQELITAMPERDSALSKLPEVRTRPAEPVGDDPGRIQQQVFWIIKRMLRR
ncbi:MAG: hypothetical protein ACLR1G_09660 [Alistipes indistinctus]